MSSSLPAPVILTLPDGATREVPPGTLARDVVASIGERLLKAPRIFINVGGRAAVPAMQAARWGRIVNIAARSGLVGVARATHYAAAKHRIDSIVRGLISIGVHQGEHVGVLMEPRPTALTVVAALK